MKKCVRWHFVPEIRFGLYPGGVWLAPDFWHIFAANSVGTKKNMQRSKKCG